MAYEYTRQNDLFEDVAYLCKKKTYVDENGVVIEDGYEEHEVFAKVGGVYQKEFFDAYQSGIKAQFYILVSAFDYQDEEVVKYRESPQSDKYVYYIVYRKYPKQEDEWELYLREDVGTWNSD